MHRTGESAEIAWRGGVPVSPRFDDPFYGGPEGLGESRHVFLGGNGLPDRFRPGFRVAELGFGTGLNALAAWDAWMERGVPGALRFTSFERYPIPAAAMARALAPWPELAALARPLIAGWSAGARVMRLDGLDLEVIEGDARSSLPGWTGQADAWFLDGFAPTKNPELWEAPLLAEVARHTASGGTFATYSAAGEVRRRLDAAGFAVARRTGFGDKRHMTRGRMEGP